MLGHATPKEKIEKIKNNPDCLKEVRNNTYLGNFIEQYSDNESIWNSNAIKENASKMAQHAYRNVWKFEPPL
jgi:hypothetical protein